MSVATKLLCHHCGDPCVNDEISKDDYFFCCVGCQSVYSLLKDNDLCNYYDIEQHPGITFKWKNNENYDYLNDENLLKSIVTFNSENLTIIVLKLPNIHCSSCLWLLEKMYKFDEGILESKVNFMAKEITVKYNPKLIKLGKIASLLDSLGYPPLLSQESSSGQSKKTDQSYLLKIAFAGFAFGNIMLFAFPEYLGLEEMLFKKWFGWLSFILSIPLVFYAGNEFLISAFKVLKHKKLNIDIPISLGILAIFFKSSADFLFYGQSGYFDSLAGLIFFLLVGRWFQKKTYDHISFERDYKSYFPLSIILIKNEIQTPTLISNLKVEDEILIKNAQLVPADSILLTDEAYFDYSFVTGESKSILVQSGEKVFAGAKLIGKSVSLKLTSDVVNSYLVKLWQKDETDRDELQDLIDKFSQYFTISILSLSITALLVWLFIDSSKALHVFSSILIVACPCALALAVPFIYGNALRILSTLGIFVKNDLTLRKLSFINHIVFDKTGTLTLDSEKNINYKGEVLTEEESAIVHAVCFQSTHPLSIRLEKLLRRNVILYPEYFNEIPGKGLEAIVNKTSIKLGSDKLISTTEAIQYKDSIVHLEIDGKYKGYFLFKSNYRKNLQSQISILQKTNDIDLISGDNNSEEEILFDIFNNKGKLLFGLSPFDKVDFIRNLKRQKGKNVMMVGDGLNDSGALSESDIGMAIASNASNFTPASDIIISANNFNHISDLMKYSKSLYFALKVALLIAIIYNIIGLSFAITGNLSPIIAAILMPISSISIVIFGVVTSYYLYRKNFDRVEKYKS